jgi:hypothetical protein
MRNLAFVALAHVAVFVLFSASIPAAQAKYGTEKEARAMLEKAVAALKENKEKALAMFNKGEGASGIAISMCFVRTHRTAS